MGLMACGSFQTAIKMIQRHPKFSAQDPLSIKVVDELDSMNRTLQQAESQSA